MTKERTTKEEKVLSIELLMLISSKNFHKESSPATKRISLRLLFITKLLLISIVKTNKNTRTIFSMYKYFLKKENEKY